MKNTGSWSYISVALLAGTLLITTPALSQGSDNMPDLAGGFGFEPEGEAPELMPDPLFEDNELALSDEQKAKLRELRQAFRKEQIQARADAQIVQMELRELMTAENPNRAAISKMLDQMAQARTARALAGFDHRQSMQAVFTPDQLAKMKEMRKSRRAHRRMGRAGARAGRRAGRGMGRAGNRADRGTRRGMQRGFRGRQGRHGQSDCTCANGPDGHGPMRQHEESEEGDPEGHGNSPD